MTDPQNPPAQDIEIEAPDGTIIAFPATMSEQDIGKAMSKLYPSKPQQPPAKQQPVTSQVPAAPVSKAPELDPFGDVIAKPSQLQQKEIVLPPPSKMTEGMPYTTQRQNLMELERKEELSAEIARQNMFANSQFAGMNEQQLAKAKQAIEAEKMAFDKIGQSIKQRAGSLKSSAEQLEVMRGQFEQQIKENPALQPELSAQYDAAVEAHNKEARTVQELIPIAEDYASKLGLDEMAATMQDYEIKKGKGNWGGAIANEFTGSVASTFAGVLDFNQVIDRAILSAVGNKEALDLYDKGTKGVVEYTRGPVADLMRIESTTKEYIQEKEKGLIGGALLGLAGSAVPMMTPAMSGIFFQSYDGMKQEMSGPEWADVSENEKAALAATTGIIAASLERFGFRNMAKSTPVVRQILGSSLPKMIPGMTAGQIRRLVDAETDSWIRNAIVKTGSGFLAEVETGAAQEAADIGMKELYNEAKGRNLFQTPESFVDAFGQVVRSGIQEGIGGGIMSAPFAYSAARKAGAVGKAQTKKQYEFMEKLFTDPDYVDSFKASAEARVKAGEVTQSEVDKAVDDLAVAKKLMEKMPEDMPADKRRQAFDLLLEKERLSKKEKAMVEGKVQDIDNELRKLAGIETKTPTTDKTSTNTATIKQNDGSVSKDGGHRFIVDGRISLPVKGDGSQDAIRETTAWADEVTSLNDGTIILTDPDNGPVQKLVVGRGVETSFWLEDAKTGEVMWKSGDNIGLLKSRVGNGDILSKPTEEELNTDTKGDAERDELIQMRNDRGVFFDPMDDLPDQVVRTMNRVDNGVPTDPVSLNEASNWLYGKRKQIASMATDPNRMMTRNQIDGLLAEIDDSISTIETYKYEQREKGSTDASENYTGEKGEHQAAAIDSANAVRTPNEGTAKIDPEGDLTDDQLNALAEDPSLAATKAITSGGVDVNDSAAINELSAKLQGVNKAGADYSSVLAKVAKAAATLRSITPGVSIKVHETSDTVPAEGSASGVRGMFVSEGRDENGNLKGTIHINLDQATENTIAHEIGHVALRQAFGADPKLFTQFKERIKKAVKPSDFKAVEAMMGKDYSSAEAPEEFLADLTQMVSDRIDSGDPLTAKEITVIDKVVAIINDFLKALGIDPILVDPRDARATLEFFRDLGAAANAGVAVNTELAEGVTGAGTVYSKADSNVVRLLKGSEFLNAAPAQRKQMLIDARAQDASERAAQEAKVVAQAKAAGAKQERVRSKEDLSKMKEQYKAFIDSYDAATKKSMAELEEEFIARNAKDVDLARAAIDNLKAQLQESKEDLKRVAKDGFNLGRGIGSVEGEVRGIGEGLKQAAAAQKKIREDVAAYLSLIKQKGDISVAQSKALINAAMRIKVGDPASFTKFENYVDKVMDDVAYAARIEQIRKLQAKANKKKHSINGSLVQAFTSIDPELIPDDLMPRYISALTELSLRNPRYATMTAITSDVEALKQPEATGKYDAADTYEKLAAASQEIMTNPMATVSDYTRMLSDVRDFNRQANALLENGTIDEDQYTNLTDGAAKTVREFNEQNKDAIDVIRKTVIDDIKVARSYVDLEETSDPDKKLLQDAATLSDKQMMALDPVQLQDLSELISNGVTDGYVDSFRLHPIVVKAKLYADAENLANNLRKVSKDQNELEKILARTDTSYWSSAMGIEARHASLFDKMIIAPWLHADGGRIKFKTEANNELYKLKKKYGLNPPLAKKVINDAIARTIPNPAMDKIGMVVRYLEEYELGTKKEGFDEFGSYGKRDQFSPEAMAKLNDGEKMKGAGREETMKNWEKAWKSFPKTDGRVDPSDVYESVMANDGRYLTKEEGGFLKELLEWKSKNITPKQRYANSLRGIPFNELQFHMPRRAIGPRTQGEEDALTTPVAGGNRLRIRSGTGFARKDTKLKLMETNIESLFSDNAESTARDFYFTPALSEVSTALSEMDKQLAGEGNTKGVVSKVRDAVQQSINSGLTPTKVNKLLSLGMAAQSMRVLFRLQRVPIEMLSSFIESGARVGSIEPYKRAFTQYNGLRDDAFRLMSDTGSQFANKLANLRHLELKQGEIQDQGAVFKASMAMAAAPETVMVVPVWTTVFESSFKDTTGENFSMEKYKSSAIYRATHKDAIKSSGVMADTAWGRFAGSGTAVGQKRKQNALVADVDTKSNTGAILSYMTGYTERQRQALLDGIRYAVQTIKGESGIEKARGTAALATTATGIMTGALTYAMGMQIAYLASQYLTGDDDEKRKAKEEMDRLGNADYMAGEAMASAISLIGTKYGGLGRHLLRSIGSAYYSHLASQSTKDMDPDTKREHKNRIEWVKKAVRNFTYFDPVDITAGASPTKAAGQAMLDIIPAWSAVGTLANEVQRGYKSTKDLMKVDRDMEDSMILMTQASLALWNAIGFMYGWQAPSRLWDKKAATITKEQELGKDPTTPAGYRARAKAQIMKRVEEERQMESEKEFSEKELMDKLSPDNEE